MKKLNMDERVRYIAIAMFGFSGYMISTFFLFAENFGTVQAGSKKLFCSRKPEYSLYKVSKSESSSSHLRVPVAAIFSLRSCHSLSEGRILEIQSVNEPALSAYSGLIIFLKNFSVELRRIKLLTKILRSSEGVTFFCA